MSLGDQDDAAWRGQSHCPSRHGPVDEIHRVGSIDSGANPPAGGSVTFGLIGSTAGGANPAPGLVALNGTACTVS